MTRPDKLVTWFTKSALSPLLACADSDSGALLREQQIQEVSHDDLTLVQTGPSSVRIHLSDEPMFNAQVDVPIQGLAVQAKPQQQLAVWSGRTVLTYETGNGALECISSSITSTSPHLALTGGNIYTFSEELDKLKVHSSREAIEKQVMHIGSAGTQLDSNGSYLAVSCHPSHIRVYEPFIARCEFIHQVRVNASGNQVAFLDTDQSGNEDGRVYLLFYCLTMYSIRNG